MTGTITARFVMPAAHPALPGHFPGRPVVPGVVLLDQVIAAACRHVALGPARALPRVKFLAPVVPEQEVVAEITRPDATRIAFTCRVAGTTVASGDINCVPYPGDVDSAP